MYCSHIPCTAISLYLLKHTHSLLAVLEIPIGIEIGLNISAEAFYFLLLVLCSVLQNDSDTGLCLFRWGEVGQITWNLKSVFVLFLSGLLQIKLSILII